MIWSKSVDSPPEEEAVMQISGAGHWFLEGWIGDHAVDFLVDSGSAVTAVSSSFYNNLREAMNRRLRGANGSRIDILLVLSGLVFRTADGVPHFSV